jgi:hypothetical protein
MSYIYYNPNLKRKHEIDCPIRAISKLENATWHQIYWDICKQGAIEWATPNSDIVWSRYLQKLGYKRHSFIDTCPDCYTVRDFCIDHPYGRYLLKLNEHVVAVVNGDYYDSWDSGDETVIYYYTKEA